MGRNIMNNSDRLHLMAHLVAGFPDKTGSIEVGRGLVEGGAEYLEVQFPYSDPTADGPTIQTACGRAVEDGFRVNDGFDVVETLAHETNGETPIFVMSYAGLVFARGVERFVRDAKERGAIGLIVPDLMPGYDEGLFDIARREEMTAVPVVAPSVTPTRLAEILELRSPFVYAAIRTGITGTKSVIDEHVREFLMSVRRPSTRLIAGFGITEYEQARALQQFADVLVVGSAFVRVAIDAASTAADMRESIRQKALELTGGADRSEEEKAAL